MSKKKDIKSGIYKFTNLKNNKIYIGSSINITSRKSNHISLLNNNIHHNRHLQNSWDKYGKENFEFEIIEYIDNIEELVIREQYWIDFYKSCDIKNGYNLSPTAGSTYGYKFTEEQKQNIKDGLKNSEKVQEYMLLRKINRKITNRKTLSEANTGENNPSSKLNNKDVLNIFNSLIDGVSIKELALKYNVCTRTIHKIKNGLTWKNIITEDMVRNLKERTQKNVLIEEDDMLKDMYSKKRIILSARIPIIQLSVEGDFIKEWGCASEAAKLLKFDASTITSCCKGKYNTSKGYKWMYKSEYENDLEEVG